ncbi:MAG TPA: Holliday junction resolvase RuvX [Steroidobacteraceae bacterium]|nr:Holliday junction resolvase RuvX [Steroidobacteraceae bacterium]
MPDPAAHWTALAFDYGHKRIGVAAGDSVTRRATPVTTLKVGSSGIDWSAIEQVVNEWQPAVLIVGVPLNADGSPGELARSAQRFARGLKRYGVAIDLIDERFSSLEAAQHLKTARASGQRKRRVRRTDVDAAAACVILERWFERSPAERAPPVRAT